MMCSELVDIIRKYRYRILNIREDDKSCIIDFIHPSVTLKTPVHYFASSIYYDKTTGHIEATIRRKIDKYKELYLDYCCEDCKMVCRPHVWMEEKILSIEAKFHKNSIERLKALLTEMM